jgi:tetratricopeptide (TPR) repeat protein
MAFKTKRKTKAAKKAAPTRKSSGSKGKAASRTAAKTVRARTKPSTPKPRKPVSRVEPQRLPSSRETQSRLAAVQKIRSKEYSSAIHAYESGLKLMHQDEYEKAIKAFHELLAVHSEEPEIQERARVLIHACQKKLNASSKLQLRSADDHYNMGVAELNRRQLDAAIQHFQHALKLAPRGDHILYAMAAANALKGNRDEALSYLRQSVLHRPENRFLALRDSDFEGLIEDADFRQITTSEK